MILKLSFYTKTPANDKINDDLTFMHLPGAKQLRKVIK
jgi:hypothetical protein